MRRLVSWQYQEREARTVAPRFRAQGVVGGVVPLSEHEQRQLEQIEQALYSEDPKFVHAVRSSDPRVHYRRRALRSTTGFVLGVALLLAGVISRYIWIGVAGFVVMLACSMWALTSWRRLSGMTGFGRGGTALRRGGRMGGGPGGPAGSGHPRGRRGPKGPKGPGMMERFEERWRRRQEGDR
ncbi:MAG TPA: DUF3040 domain-containing protein [Streptosporangiaceae bacterium]|nr:DUF3040 domain-containing protein [Streptosporangiaceae bacterium]